MQIIVLFIFSCLMQQMLFASEHALSPVIDKRPTQTMRMNERSYPCPISSRGAQCALTIALASCVQATQAEAQEITTHTDTVDAPFGLEYLLCIPIAGCIGAAGYLCCSCCCSICDKKKNN